MRKFVILTLLFFILFTFSASGTLAQLGGDNYAAHIQYPPRLEIVHVRADPSSPAANETFKAFFQIRVHGSYDLKNAIIEFADESNFRVMERTNQKFSTSRLTRGSNNWVFFDLKRVEGSRQNNATLNISYYYNNSSGSQSLRVNLPMDDLSEMTRPNLNVQQVLLEPHQPGPTEVFTAMFNLKNLSDVEARNVDVELQGLGSFNVVDHTNRKNVEVISQEQTRGIFFQLRGVENRDGNNVKLTLSYNYPGQTEKVTQTISAFLPLEEIPVTRDNDPLLRVDSFIVEHTGTPEEYLLKMTLKNIGKGQARDIKMTFEGENHAFLHRTNVDYLESLDKEDQVELEYLLEIDQSPDNTYYPLTLQLSYNDERHNCHESSETLSIPASSLQSTMTMGEPRVLISKYTLCTEKILAGNVVALDLFIDNTHTRPVQNIKVSLGVAQVEGGTTGTSGSSVGTVFSPVRGSNSFFVERIPSRTTLERSVDLLVDPNATAKTYIIPVTIEYEDEDGEGYRVEEMVNIPVTQESRMQVISVEVPPLAFAGQPAFVSAEFVNVGKVDLGNFMVMLEGDFHKEQAAYFVGNLQIGASDFYQGVIYPEREGTLEGELVFSYLDNNNQEVKVVEPFRMEVQAERMEEAFPGERPPHMGEPDGYGRGGVNWIYYLALFVIIAAALVIIILRRRRAKKSEEEFLDAE